MISRTIFSLWRVFVVVTCLVASTTASAVSISGFAFIDSASLSLNALQGSASLSFRPSFNFVETNINGTSNFVGDMNPVFLFADDGEFTEAAAFADTGIVSAQTVIGGSQGLATVTAFHELEYRAHGSGQVRIDVAYSLDHEILYPSGSDIALLTLVELLDQSSNTIDDAVIFNETDDLLGRPFSASGVLSITVDVNDGDVGFLQFSALSDSIVQAVPLPASVFLFASSLPLLAGPTLRRSKRNKVWSQV